MISHSRMARLLPFIRGIFSEREAEQGMSAVRGAFPVEDGWLVVVKLVFRL